MTNVFLVQRSSAKATDESEQGGTHVGDILDSNDHAKCDVLGQRGIGKECVHVGQDQVHGQNVGGRIGTGLGRCWRTESRVSAREFVTFVTELLNL